jgi:energy-coupling factor transport system permease protein
VSRSDITIGGYLPGNSLLHGLDARTKILGFILVLVSVFVHPGRWGTASTGLVVIGLAVTTGVGWRVWWWGLMRFSWMIAITAGLNMVLGSDGAPVTVLGVNLPFTWDGLRNSLIFSVQLLEAITLSMVLTFSTSPAALTRGIQKLAAPLQRFGLPVEEYGTVLLLAMRFVPLVQQEVRTIVDAQKSRGVNFHSGGVASRGRSLLAVLVPALTAALRRADVLATAMSARGYRPGQPRSQFQPQEFARMDYVGVVCVGLFFLGRYTLFL